jgi:hypothetical protein
MTILCRDDERRGRVGRELAMAAFVVGDGTGRGDSKASPVVEGYVAIVVCKWESAAWDVEMLEDPQGL